MKLEYKTSNIIRGGLIYAIGDTIAALISHDFSLLRLTGILVIGATLYALEIPNYFKWIDKKTKGNTDVKTSFYRSFLAMMYFNPLWIARHVLLLKIVTGNFDQISWSILKTGSISFLINIPVSLLANYIIQNKIPLDHRFLASAIFSGLMAIYYSLSAVWFG